MENFKLLPLNVLKPNLKHNNKGGGGMNPHSVCINMEIVMLVYQVHNVLKHRLLKTCVY